MGNTNLQRELTTVRSQNSQLRGPNHSAAAKALRTQNALMRSKIRTLTDEHKGLQVNHAQEIDTLKKQISSLQCQIRTSVLNWQVNLRNKHASGAATASVSPRVHRRVSSRPRRPLNGIDYF